VEEAEGWKEGKKFKKLQIQLNLGLVRPKPLAEATEHSAIRQDTSPYQQKFGRYQKHKDSKIRT